MHFPWRFGTGARQHPYCRDLKASTSIMPAVPLPGARKAGLKIINSE
ncbi:hypothetical protein EP837_03826 (plasmid) [Sphingobium sp. EP60837]|nr:hypothetical protein EP837_03826 [Sphingobium sp. EP60837]